MNNRLFQKLKGLWVTPYKIQAQSASLGRQFHCDVFEGVNPSGVVIIFGGSGKTRDIYWSRAESVHPELLEYFQRHPLIGVHCVYVTAPYDLPYARSDLFESKRKRWNEHVVEDLFNRWTQLPIYLVGYSGGIVLALSGAHEEKRVVGVSGLGADGIPEDLEVPYGDDGRPRWILDLKYCQDEPVRRFNSEVIEELTESALATVGSLTGRGHSFQAYLNSGGMAAVFQRAQGAFLKWQVGATP